MFGMATQELLILTGMSGAGRSTVAHALEDLGWYVVDNLPPSLLPQLAEQSLDTHQSLVEGFSVSEQPSIFNRCPPVCCAR